MGTHLPENNFRRVLLDAVDESLSSLGDSPKQAILFHLETSFKLKKENIPNSLTEFANAIEEIFGFGATYIEKLIVRNLCEKLGIQFEEMESCNFLECVSKARKRTATNLEC
jgi:hypothetical protein